MHTKILGNKNKRKIVIFCVTAGTKVIVVVTSKNHPKRERESKRSPAFFDKKKDQHENKNVYTCYL